MVQNKKNAAGTCMKIGLDSHLGAIAPTLRKYRRGSGGVVSALEADAIMQATRPASTEVNFHCHARVYMQPQRLEDSNISMTPRAASCTNLQQLTGASKAVESTVTLEDEATAPIMDGNICPDTRLRPYTEPPDENLQEKVNEDDLCSSARVAQEPHKPLPLDPDSVTSLPRRQPGKRACAHRSGRIASSARSTPRRTRKRNPDGTPVRPLFPRFVRAPPLRRHKASAVNHSNQDLDADDMMSEGSCVLSILTHISRTRSASSSSTLSSCSPSYRNADGLIEIDSADAVVLATSGPSSQVQKHRLSGVCSNSLCNKDEASRACATCVERLQCTPEARIKKPDDSTCWASASHETAEAASSGTTSPATRDPKTPLQFSASSGSRPHSAPEVLSDVTQSNVIQRSVSNVPSANVGGKRAVYTLPLYPRFVTSPRFMDENVRSSLQMRDDRIDNFFCDGATRAALVSAAEKSNASAKNEGLGKKRRSGKLEGVKRFKMPSLSLGSSFLGRTCRSAVEAYKLFYRQSSDSAVVKEFH